MRHLRCEKCMEDKQAGTRMLYARSAIGEPAEFERVVLGVARTPQADQRYMIVNGTKEPLPPDIYNCDGCGKEIKPGERCGTWTVWTDERGPIAEWEHELIDAVPLPADQTK